jgi:hypothetical protein
MYCFDCGTPLIGQYCHRCGTRHENYVREPLSFDDLSYLFSKLPSAEDIVRKYGVGNRLPAIKEYRRLTNLSLKQAKEAIDEAYWKIYPEEFTK